MHSSNVESRVVTKVMWRLIPFLIVLYVFNYLDRVNINVAKLEMNKDLGLSDYAYGLGVSIFFIGYFIFEVPSNIIMERVGARVWIARIMISWGLVSTAFMFVKGEKSFYALRFLLGATEAGFFPGILLYLTYWIPARQRARVGAVFMTSIALSGLIGNPLNGWIMQATKGSAGLAGWQWIFLIEGIPTVLLGVAVLYFLTDKPEHAEWLETGEREWLCAHLNDERARTHAEHGRHHFIDALKSGRVWLLSLIYMTLMIGFYPINYWAATIIKEVYPKEWLKSGELEVSSATIGLLNALPFVGAIIGMVIIGRISDRLGQPRKVVAACQFVGCLGIVGVSQMHGFASTMVCLTIAAIGIFGALAPFWSLPPAFLSGTAAAAGLAFINSWGNLGGGYAGNHLMGYLKDKYKNEPFSYSYGLLADAGALALGVGLTLSIKLKRKSVDDDAVSQNIIGNEAKELAS